MEVPLSHYQSFSLDQDWRFPFSFSYKKLFRDNSLFSGYCCFSKRKWGNPFVKIRCFSLDQGQRPRRPQLRPQPKLDTEIKEVRVDETQIKKSSLRICSQIKKLVLCGKYKDALDFFEILELEDGFDVEESTYDFLVDACIRLRSYKGVKRVYYYMIRTGFEPDQYMRNRVLLMHVRCGMMIDARKLFDEMPERSFVTWNVMINGTIAAGDYLEAFRLFLDMWEELSDADPRTLTMLISSAASLEDISIGRQLHSCAIKMGFSQHIFVSCALIDMYGKCGSIEEAQYVFDEMPEKTTVGWNTLIGGYALNGYSEKALNMYHDMQSSGFKLDHFALSMIMGLCARLASLECAKQAHAGLIRQGFGSDMVANTALIDFYSKWGRMEQAQRVFDSMPSKNLLSWNALIAGYGNHGRGEEALERFEQLLRERLRPNHVTLLAVLSACSYSGLFKSGWKFFQSMGREHSVKPRAMHFACMIELLGRKGLLDEAFALIKAAPFEPTENMWAALVTASRAHGNLQLGKFAVERLCLLEPEKCVNYVVLLNIYMRSGNLKEAAAVVQTMKRRGLRMGHPFSWIEVKSQSYAFQSRDKSHPQRKEICQKVYSLIKEISKLGYIPDVKTLLPDVNEQEQHNVSYHSEKLALAFGLISTPGWMPLQIVQSHRICNDCHNAFKLIARVTRREIVVRDGSRFHRFKDGNCSCGDYW